MCMIPGLGNPKEDRVSFQWGDGSGGRAVMRTRQQGCLARVRGLGGCVGVLCVERDSVCCYWQVVLGVACELDPGVETCDLS